MKRKICRVYFHGLRYLEKSNVHLVVGLRRLTISRDNWKLLGDDSVDVDEDEFSRRYLGVVGKIPNLDDNKTSLFLFDGELCNLLCNSCAA